MIPNFAAIRPDRLAQFLKPLGLRWRDGRSLNFKWGELSRSWGLALELINFRDDDDRGHWSLKLQPVYGQVYIRLPFLPRMKPTDDMLDSWGISWPWSVDEGGATMFLRWGRHHKIIYMPWKWEYVRHSVLRPDGLWVPFVGSWEVGENSFNAGKPPKDPDGRAVEQHPYRYVCDSGTVQNVTASIHVEEWEHRWRWAMWSHWPRLVHRSISIEFSEEVGDRAGSWKGGCTGCGYSMKIGETPFECLRRMQRERRFR